MSASQAPDTTAAANGGFWSTVRESLAGSHHDYTRGSIPRAILLLAIPMVLEMVLESVFAVTDIFFVGRLGPDAVATVGLTESLLTVIYAVAMGLSVSLTAMVARRIGERDPEGAAHAALQGLQLGAVLAIIIGVAGALLAPRLLTLMGADTSVLATGVNYTRVMLGGEMSVVVLFLANGVFRGAGDPSMSMRVLWLANGINIVLGPCLIFGLGPFPALGVTGAAVATTIGRATGATIAVVLLFRGTNHIKLVRERIGIDRALARSIVVLSGPATLQMLIGMASWIGLVRIVSSFGSDALAGYTIAIRIVIFALLPSFGLANAAATMVGQALGAGDPARAEASVWRAAWYNTLFLTAVGIVFLVTTGHLVGFFTADPAVHAYASDGLRFIAYGFVFYGAGMVLAQSFNGAGDTRTPTILNLVVFWAFEIPLAYVLAKPLGMGPRGVFLAVTLAFSVFTPVSALVFRRGGWKTARV
jgi:putative MATE family efflux protein